MKTIRILRVKENYPYDLLLLADETVEAINKYLFDSEVFIVKTSESEDPIGVFCLFRVDRDTVELKNIAIAEKHQGKGIGSKLLSHIAETAKLEGYKQIIVGTGDCGFKQIRFYERNGFSKYEVRENFFVENYELPIIENGIRLKDMIMLKKEIQ